MLRDAIHLALTQQQHKDLQPRYRVLLDEADLEAGDAWRPVNDGWLWSSDGVVLLLNQAALRDESYVLHEFTILWLRWREARDHFRFVIVRFPDVEDDLLQRKLGPLQLLEVQQIKLTEVFRDNVEQTKTADVKSEIATVVAKVISAMQNLPVTQSSTWTETQLINTLTNETAQSIQLRPLCALLDLTQDILAKGKEEASRLIIRRLLNPEKPIGAERFEELRAIVDYLITLFRSRDQVQLFIHHLFPHLWVNAEAAMRLCRIAYRSEGPRTVVWTRNWVQSEEMYLRRAWCTRLRLVLPVSAKSGDAEDWNNKVHEALSMGFGCNPATTSADKLRNRIRKLLDRQGEPVWVVLSASLIGSDIMEKLRSKWPEVLFFIFDSEDERAKPADWEWSQFERVTPALDLSIEEDAVAEWTDLMRQLDEGRSGSSTGRASK